MPDGSRRSSSMSPSIPGGGEHSEAARLVALYPMLPAQGRHPQPVDQDDGVGGGRVGGIFGGHGLLLMKGRGAAQAASRAYASESASGIWTFLFSSGGAGGSLVTSRISSSSRVSRSSRAPASASSSPRCSVRSRRASS